jgi:hypothetical protein
MFGNEKDSELKTESETKMKGEKEEWQLCAMNFVNDFCVLSQPLNSSEICLCLKFKCIQILAHNRVMIFLLTIGLSTPCHIMNSR